MKKAIVFLSLILTFALHACCVKENALKEDGVIERYDVVAFDSFIHGKKVQLVDVRTAEEFAEGAIPGAMNIDVTKDDFMQKATAKLKKDRPVAVYCRSGKRSMMAAEKLSDAQFKVYNLDGGILAWKNAGKKVK